MLLSKTFFCKRLNLRWVDASLKRTLFRVPTVSALERFHRRLWPMRFYYHMRKRKLRYTIGKFLRFFWKKVRPWVVEGAMTNGFCPLHLYDVLTISCGCYTFWVDPILGNSLCYSIAEKRFDIWGILQTAS